MARKSDSTEAIQSLLDERLQILEWLKKLDAAGEDTPHDVRAKVRADYQSRLDKVAGELEGFSDELAESLSQQKSTHGELSRSEKEAETQLAEAKLRHAVGEYADSQWEKTQTAITKELEQVRKDLDTVGSEISRLEEVLSLVQTKPAAAAAPATSARGGKGDAEMPFLKSVSEDEAQGPAAAHATGAVVSHDPEPIAPGPEVQRAAAAAIPSTGPKKTLKCGECGVMNFPTEWYCERCGAELAAL